MAEVYNGAYSGLGESSNLQNDDFYAIFRFLPWKMSLNVKFCAHFRFFFMLQIHAKHVVVQFSREFYSLIGKFAVF